jgi:hypothetical protein
MSAIELKSNFHKLIDSINNEDVLSKFYAILEKTKESIDGALWNKLSFEEQQELKNIEKESHDSNNLISQADMTKKHNKWL